MASLTIGKKVTFGFAALVALLALASAVAFYALDSAGRRLTLFAESARETYAAASLESAMQGLKLPVHEFLATSSAESIAAYEKARQALDVELAQAARRVLEPGRAREIARARELLGQYGAGFQDLVANQQARAAIENGILTPQAKVLAEGLQQLLKQAQTSGDMNAAFQIATGLKSFFEGTSQVNAFLLTSDRSRAKAAAEALAYTLGRIQLMEKEQLEMEKLDAALRDEPKKALLASLQQAVSRYARGLDDVVANKDARDRILAERMNRVAPEFTAAVGRVKHSVHEYQDELERRTRADQVRNELVVGSVAVAGIVLGLALGWRLIRGVTRGITGVAGRLASESEKADASATQVAQASLAMAEGATRQAASLEETSSSLHEMASMTQRNSENAQNAKALANEARQTADAGAAEMKQMKQAMGAIKGASVEIAKIIKTIDEIAFQTNILALNAAVEAARAGEAGLGFAVVAEEVRSLAQRCAGAARETAEKISASSDKSEQGVRISEKMAANLSAILEKTRQLDERIGEIAQSSQEQSQGINELNSAVSGIDKITQANAALAQQSASASEELKAQAGRVRQAVDELMRMAQDDSRDVRFAATPAAAGSRPATSDFGRTESRRSGAASRGGGASGGAPRLAHGAKGIALPADAGAPVGRTVRNGRGSQGGAGAGEANGKHGTNGSNGHSSPHSRFPFPRGSADDLSFEDRP